MSLLSCKPPKTTWGSGEGGKSVKQPKGLSYHSFFRRFTSNAWDSGHGFRIGYESSDVTQWSYNSGACGGSFSTPNGILISPSYPDNYPKNADCVYTISQPNGTAIVLAFHSMDILVESSGICRHYLEIRDGSSAASPLLGELCGYEIPTPIQSSQNQVWMKWGETVCNSTTLTLIDVLTFRFQSRGYGNGNKGFQLEYSTIAFFTDCGGVYTNARSVLTSPSYPNPYPHPAECIYFISQPNGTYVNISFITMDLNCQKTYSFYDYVELRDGNSEGSPLMGSFCGNGSNVPAFMQTMQNHLRIRWRRETY